VTNQLEEKIMKSLITVVAALAISSGSLCFAADRGANVYNLQMLHSSGGEFFWQEMGSGVNQFEFTSTDYSNTFEMAFVIEGSVDINLAAIDGLEVHAISGGPAPTLEIGDVTFTDGYYVFSNAGVGMDDVVITTPGVSPFRISDEPLWTVITSVGGDVHWQHRNGQLVYEFTGNGNTYFYADLSHASGPSDEECFWFGSISSADITLPTEAEQGGATIPAGLSSINGGGLEPYRLVFSFGEEEADPLPEDINGDGVVDLEDLLALIAAWGSTSP
jgi:hypothetical protein